MKILFGVSSVGLGHARRSMAIASELRRLGDYEIDWVSSEPATVLLQSIEVLPICSSLKSQSTTMEDNVKNGKLDDISRVARRANSIGRENYRVLRDTLPNYDAIIQDEFIETMFSFLWDNKPPLPEKRVVITDYFQFKTRSKSPMNRIVTWYANRMLVKAYSNSGLRIFVDEAVSLPRKMPKFEIVGPIIERTPEASREQMKERLFPRDNRSLIVVSVGGTSAGKYIFDFILSNLDSIRASLGDIFVVFLLGSRLERGLFPKDSEDARFVEFTLEALSYFRAADCVVTQAGGSTLNEIASIGTPCVVIPIKNHWEQEENAQRFSQRFGFQIMRSNELSTEKFTSAVKRAISSRYAPMNSDGLTRAGLLISDYLRA